MLRSWDCLSDVQEAAIASAPAIGEVRDQATTAARDRYALAIAKQILTVETHELEPAARAIVALAELRRRAAAVRAHVEQAAIAAAERSAAERRAAQDAADRVADTSEAERELEQLLREHGLPTTLRTGPYFDAHWQRLLLLARTRRRLTTTAVDAIRLSIGHGRGLYGCKELASGIGRDRPAAELLAMLGELDVAEGRPS